jgi:hypothetical protein
MIRYAFRTQSKSGEWEDSGGRNKKQQKKPTAKMPAAITNDSNSALHKTDPFWRGSLITLDVV